MIRYIVQKGDTIYKLANRFGVTINAIYAANTQLERGQYIYPGQVIYVPQNQLTEYMVQPRDTMYLIAEKFDVPFQTLLEVNPHIRQYNNIRTGQIVYIPRTKPTDIVLTNEEYGYGDLVTDLSRLKDRYPWLHIEDIGESVMGKTLYAIRLGKGRKEIFYSADWHANEYLTAPLLMKFIENYAEAYTQKRTLRGYDVHYLYENCCIWIIPMVNPDGVELVLEGITPEHPYYQRVLNINNGSKDFSGWTANIRGVDLNHQWPANWEEENSRSPQEPSPRKYGGPEPLSEPETQSIYYFTLQHDFEMVIAYHSQGQVIYWGFENLEPEESYQIVNRFAVLTGYVPVKTADSAAGYKDWFIQNYRKPGYTVEVGIGNNPLPISQFPQIYNRNLSLLLEAPLQ